VRQDPRIVGHDGGAERAHRAAARDVFVMNRLRFVVETIFDLIDRFARLRPGGNDRFIRSMAQNRFTRSDASTSSARTSCGNRRQTSGCRSRRSCASERDAHRRRHADAGAPRMTWS